MAKILTYIFFTSILVCILTNCRKHKTQILPEITAEGKRTFGCLINGKVFEPKGNVFAPPLHCTYERRLPPDEGTMFVCSAVRKDRSEPCTNQQIVLYVDSIPLEEGRSYILGRETAGSASALYSITKTCGFGEPYRTSDVIKGELNIHFLDTLYQIVSGTFWFDAVSASGDTVHITEGRFDQRYIQ